MELLPGRSEEYEFRAAQWFSGIEWHGVTKVDGDDQAAEQWRATTENLRLWRQLADLELERMKIRYQIATDAGGSQGDPAIRAVLGAYKTALATQDDAIERLRQQLGIGNDDA